MKTRLLDRIKPLNDRNDIYLTGVYKVFHIDNPDEFYIGSTRIVRVKIPGGNVGATGFVKRFYMHLYSIRNGIHSSKKFQSFVNDHGIGGVCMEILEICEPSICKQREQFYLDTFSPVLNTYSSSRGALGSKHSKETREKMSLLRKGVPRGGTKGKSIADL